jgi:hypothetical protein
MEYSMKNLTEREMCVGGRGASYVRLSLSRTSSVYFVYSLRVMN